ncbi:MAG: hypothetical protein HYY25_09955 [Candidatus Wallbacteria bacterium]|nr:hypothetical protein [Candidatus Wallbacteria bacterium]MBI4865909.1 hypothetical protein [Candidatus Wallbacteria bacterium]
MEILLILREYARFLSREKKWWITPIVLVLLVLVLLAMATEGTAMMPLVYTLF